MKPQQIPIPSASEKGRSAGLTELVSAENLLGGRNAIRIVHNGQIYQLSLTRNDKLILTK